MYKHTCYRSMHVRLTVDYVTRQSTVSTSSSTDFVVDWLFLTLICLSIVVLVVAIPVIVYAVIRRRSQAARYNTVQQGTDPFPLIQAYKESTNAAVTTSVSHQHRYAPSVPSQQPFNGYRNIPE